MILQLLLCLNPGVTLAMNPQEDREDYLILLSEADPSWVELFDGATLEGWTTVGGRYDGKAAWSVEGGAITGREGPAGAGGLIYTEGMYRNFELEAEMRITWPFDSGFFLRMLPPEEQLLGAQITVDHREGGEIGAVYCDGFYCHTPAGAERFQKDAWNSFRIRCVGDPMHMTVWMNGELLTDFRIPEGSGSFAQRGRIGLQVHGSPGAPADSHVQFRALRIAELPDSAGAYFDADAQGALTLTAAGRQAGWISLFDGQSLDAWEGHGEGMGYRVRDGELEFLADGSSPHLATREDFQDFQLRLDFKIGELANSGLFLRASRDGSNPAFSGCEVQILDDFNWERETGSNLLPYQKCGGLYGSLPPAVTDALAPLGTWNTYQVTYRGTRLVVYLNGRLLYDVDTLEVSVPDGEKSFAERAAAGFVGLQRHAPAGEVGREVQAAFRNIFLRSLPGN
jgi:hypothetical protein